MKFKGQLAELMTKLNTTEPHYVRCIKPNSANKPSLFEMSNVLHQLRCGGVLEAIRISCAGYPSRKPIEEFFDRFGLLSPDLLAAALHSERSTDGALQSTQHSARQSAMRPALAAMRPKGVCVRALWACCEA